jgi:hypothetical protein
METFRIFYLENGKLESIDVQACCEYDARVYAPARVTENLESMFLVSGSKLIRC